MHLKFKASVLRRGFLCPGLVFFPSPERIIIHAKNTRKDCGVGCLGLEFETNQPFNSRPVQRLLCVNARLNFRLFDTQCKFSLYPFAVENLAIAKAFCNGEVSPGSNICFPASARLGKLLAFT